jgi:hypothetical protein
MAAVAAATGLLTLPAPAALAYVPESGYWVLRSESVRAADYTDQGLATVTTPSGRPRLVTRGDDSIPATLAAHGWSHIGDPDSAAGYLLDAYQGGPAATAKMFRLTAPDGSTVQLVHRLVPGEQYHNSFAAIAPGGRWFVSGEWGTVRRLLVFPMPTLPVHATGVVNLPLAGVIALDRPVRDVQGCAFSSPTTLVCSTNDRHRDLFAVPRQLLSVRLGHPVAGGAAAASVALLGAVPTPAACAGSQEVEGIDVHGRRLLVSVVSGCVGVTTIFGYRLEPARPG